LTVFQQWKHYFFDFLTMKRYFFDSFITSRLLKFCGRPDSVRPCSEHINSAYKLQVLQTIESHYYSEKRNSCLEFTSPIVLNLTIRTRRITGI
jgi:hypothetical protein